MAPSVGIASGKTMEVIIIGGSISGLMHGIMLRSLGHNVRILEQQDSNRADYGAGMGTGPQGKKFLQEYDRTDAQLAYDCPGFKFLGPNNETRALAPSPMYLTSWTALYYRLRGIFDGLSSPFCTQPAAAPNGSGTSTFDTLKKVVGVKPSSQDHLRVEIQDMADPAKATYSLDADLVIDASGPYSVVRASVVPSASKPRYAGFVAWRGTVPDTKVTEETSKLFDTRFNIFPMPGGNYCIGYAVPGKNGSLEPGERLLNWIWYTTVASKSELDAILTDRDGHTHSNSIPRGKLNMAVWDKRRDSIRPSLNKAFMELMDVTEEPFVSTIRESFVGRRSFHNGRLLLVGDGANLMPPNAGQATNNAATSCLELRDVLHGKTTLSEWEVSVADQGWQMRLFSNVIAARFLHGDFWARVASWRLSLFLRWLGLKRAVRRVFKL
ncbi:uncharacterized protein RCC_00683 [Ramularia collo-cygni]|uniref:2,6-dihydroxypyridine 3-monooxygenase substrate binding domain-containing protein n=1 Tax=Ramularia collo-cygni TaxID=112498 RepID=A0A2D3UX79_9PEZI|nr:uncharacterized protein RCC_00683 [Ramularia collo-cygni]CZT14714.1 uncharacterized protein RCC_00683 [Ramularia collo-cygni]